MAEKVCNFCGSSDYIQKRVEYVYRHQGRYMVFRDVPAEVCRHCGMRYFSAQVLLTIERRFFEIHELHRQPAHTVVVPIETFA